MNISEGFIKRPIATSLLMAAINRLVAIGRLMKPSEMFMTYFQTATRRGRESTLEAEAERRKRDRRAGVGPREQ